MKKGVVFLAGLLIAVISVAQNQNMDEIQVTAPTYKGGFFESINDVLNNGVQYPVESKNMGLQGTEVIRFTVTVDGKISDFQVVNSVAPEMDKEVIRVLRGTSGRWNPGITNGNPVNMQKEVSLVFKLYPSVDFVAKAKQYLKKGNEMLFENNNPTKAIKYYNKGITLLPYENTLLAMRGLCNYEIGNENEARSDWERISANSTNSINSECPKEAANLKGYEELTLAMEK